jgi:hypothetical protein
MRHRSRQPRRPQRGEGSPRAAHSNSYSGSLFFNHYDNDVARITGNVLRTLMSGAPLPGAPTG